jgi:hypothetical protein
MLDVTSKEAELGVAAKLIVPGETNKDDPAPACVTVIVLEVAPVPDIVTVAERVVVVVFAVAVTVTVVGPPTAPEAGLTVSHV